VPSVFGVSVGIVYLDTSEILDRNFAIARSDHLGSACASRALLRSRLTAVRLRFVFVFADYGSHTKCQPQL